MRTHTVTESPLGDLTLVNTDGVLSGLYMSSRVRPPNGSIVNERSSQADFEQAIIELDEYFSGERKVFTVATAATGDGFQQRVWGLLKEIPYGTTRSYGEVARDLGDVALARAVGVANARNPISVIVPCHRVVGSDGSLTGYAGGLERKRFLLELEGGTASGAGTLF
jgi:methylated-DNA-[protein]-cysteine S-methyltransferase